jgi:hypothetical protein
MYMMLDPATAHDVDVAGQWQVLPDGYGGASAAAAGPVQGTCSSILLLDVQAAQHQAQQALHVMLLLLLLWLLLRNTTCTSASHPTSACIALEYLL